MDKTILLAEKLLEATTCEENKNAVDCLINEARNLLLGGSPRYAYDVYNSCTSCPLSDIYCDLYEEVFSDVQD